MKDHLAWGTWDGKLPCAPCSLATIDPAGGKILRRHNDQTAAYDLSKQQSPQALEGSHVFADEQAALVPDQAAGHRIIEHHIAFHVARPLVAGPWLAFDDVTCGHSTLQVCGIKRWGRQSHAS